jgi:hypothetical protein
VLTHHQRADRNPAAAIGPAAAGAGPGLPADAIGESFVYTDVITGDAPDAEKAHAVVTALLS